MTSTLLRSWWRLARRHLTPAALAVALLVLPSLLALCYEARDGSYRGLSYGDQAVLQLHLRQAMHGSHLLGPYSQYEWYHPGPLYYYVLSPLYALSGGATRSLFFSAGLVHLAALFGVVIVHFKLDRRLLTRFAFLAILSLSLTAFLARPPPGTFTANPLTEIWNPVVPVLPFLLLIVTAAAVAVGRWELGPLLAFLHAFTTQTHVSYALASTLTLAAAATTGWLSTRKETPSRRKRWLLLSAATIVALWLPPLIALIRSDPGNLLEIWRFTTASTGTRVSPGSAFAYALRQTHWLVLHPLVLSATAATIVGGLLTLVQCLGAATGLRASVRRRHPYLAALGLAPVAVTLVALVQSVTLTSLDENVHFYQTLWFDICGCFAWLGVLFAVCHAAERHFRLASRVLIGTTYLGVAAYALFGARQVDRDFARCREQGRRPAVLPAGLVESVRLLLEQRIRGTKPAFRPVSPGSWGTLATLLLELGKRGIDAPINSRWRFMYGNGASYAPADSPIIEVATDTLHQAPLFRAFGDFKLYVDGLERRVKPVPLAATGHGVRGDPARALREPVPSDGEAWDASEAVILGEASSHLLFALPGLVSSGLEVVADGNDDYLIAASLDGVTFQSVGAVPSLGARGLHTRAVKLTATGPWNWLKLAPGRGDGSYSIAHVALTDAAFGCRVVDASGIAGNPGRLCDGEVARAGSAWDGSRSVRLIGPSARVTVALPQPENAGGYVDGVSIESDGNDLYRIEGSLNGTDFFPIGTTAGRLKVGMRWFPFHFNDLVTWKQIRLTPSIHDGSLSLAEIRPLVNRGRLLDFGSNEARALREGWATATGNGPDRGRSTLGPSATLFVSLQPARAHDLLVRVQSAALGTKNRAIAVALNGHPIAELAVGPGVRDVSVLLPATLVAAENEIRFSVREPHAAAGGSQPLSLRFYGALFRPSVP